LYKTLLTEYNVKEEGYTTCHQMSIVTIHGWRQYNSGMDHLWCRTPFCRCDLEATEYLARIILQNVINKLKYSIW